MYYSGSSLNPSDSSAYGDLISPARQMPAVSLADGDARLRKIWSLVVLADEECAVPCAEALVQIRQIRLSLGPKMTRLQTVFMPAGSDAVSTELSVEHPVLIIAEPQRTIDLREIIGRFEQGQIFLVDPLGNLMMSYPPGTDMGYVRKDLTHLFKFSGIG
jgi:hypothetical protein